MQKCEEKYSHVDRNTNCCIDCFDNVKKQLVHALAVHMSRYEALGKFWRALKWLELTLTPISCFPTSRALYISTYAR